MTDEYWNEVLFELRQRYITPWGEIVITGPASVLVSPSAKHATKIFIESLCSYAGVRSLIELPSEIIKKEENT